MFGLGMPEIVLILVIALVVFGPGKLPDVGKAVGRSIREFKNAVSMDDNKPGSAPAAKVEEKQTEERKLGEKK